MSYGLIYTIPFAALDNTPCVVEIEREGYTGESTELTAGASPFTVDIDDDEFLYTPTRFSTAKIQIVGGDYLRSLFSTAYRQHRVTFKRDGAVCWCGYIKPEAYTQDYSNAKFTLELECLSAMSVLEYIDYTIEGENKQFVSLWRLMARCIEASRGRYEAIYVPYVYAATAKEYKAGGSDVLERMAVSEQNFFDEDGKAMTFKEVLEEVCKLLGWTCADWCGSLYFVDIDYNGVYHRYDTALQVVGDTTPNTMSVQAIGFAGADHSLDILPGYNKVTIRCSNYSISNVLDYSFDWSGLHEFEGLINPRRDDVQKGNKICHRVFLNPSGELMYQYKLNADGTFENITDLEPYKENVKVLYGALPMKLCEYEIKDGKPSITDYNYTDALQIRLDRTKKEASLDGITPVKGRYSIFQVKGPCAGYSYGAICINGAAMVCTDSEMSPLNDPVGNWISLSHWMRLSIGDYGFSPTEGWVKGYDNGFTLNMERPGGYGERYFTIPNSKTLEMPYAGASGYIIPVPKMLTGELIFESSWVGPDKEGSMIVGTIWKDFRLNYVREGEGTTNSNSDRTYENVLNDAYINELDDIELKISSYNNDGACYSKVILDDAFLTDNLYNAILDKQKRPEEMLITRIINHYSSTRIKLTQVIKYNKDISPLTVLTDKFLVNNRFINAGGAIDYAANRFECTMIGI